MGKFRKGAKRPANAGRKPWSINKTTGVLREAVLLAAELEGDVSLQPLKKAALCGESEEEAAKRGGLVGYLRFLARRLLNYHRRDLLIAAGIRGGRDSRHACEECCIGQDE